MVELTVMCWNVQNLFPVGHLAGPATDQDYADKVGALAAVIDAVGPDVLALQEVGPSEVLTDLAAACTTPLAYHMVGTPDLRGIRVALMSSRRLSNRTDIATFPAGVLGVQSRDVGFDDPATIDNEAVSGRLGRSVLAATVRVADESVTVMVAHLKSKLISYTRPPGVTGSQFAPNDEGERHRHAGYALYRRTAEAMACRDALNQVLTVDGDAAGEGVGAGRDRGVVFCGDLNDEPFAATTQIIHGPGGSEIDLTAGSGFTTADRGDGYRMWNLHPLLPATGPQYTRIYRGRGELIDHVFASHRLVDDRYANPSNGGTVRSCSDRGHLHTLNPPRRTQPATPSTNGSQTRRIRPDARSKRALLCLSRPDSHGDRRTIDTPQARFIGVCW
jgi:predicted extracellular nuclease